MATPTLADVLVLVEQLSVAEKATLMARIAPQVADAIQPVQRDAAREAPLDVPPGSRAEQFANDPRSALARARGLLKTGAAVPSDADIQRLRDERRRERFGV
jgi:hypothetical protein